ncbi:MAG: hypothetical protein WCQ87_04475 [Parabacteroides sp.]
MADIDFDSSNHEDKPKEEDNSIVLSSSDVSSSIQDERSGLSIEEIKDPNKIRVEVVDKETPVIVLFGPPSCGKTMTLVRLTRYLQGKNYTVQPITSFRPSYDSHYSQMCNDFNSMINSDNAAESTSKINFMLVKVLKGGKPICQILEGPGEEYIDPKDPTRLFPKFVYSIINSENRKIWAIMVVPDDRNMRMDNDFRMNYVTKIHDLKKRLKPTDKVVFIFNKIDKTELVLSPGVINYRYALKEVSDLYRNVFVPFKNNNPITKLWKENNFDFVGFQTGDFPKAADGTVTFEQGPDEYPYKLWEIFLKCIRG